MRHIVTVSLVVCILLHLIELPDYDLLNYFTFGFAMIYVAISWKRAIDSRKGTKQ